jgi:hypothetical protein
VFEDKLDSTYEGKIPGGYQCRSLTGGMPCAVKGMYLIVAHLQS